jgi:hypothetical protein
LGFTLSAGKLLAVVLDGRPRLSFAAAADFLRGNKHSIEYRREVICVHTNRKKVHLNFVKRKRLGLLVLGIAFVHFASGAWATGPNINYVSQTGSTVTAALGSSEEKLSTIFAVAATK